MCKNRTSWLADKPGPGPGGLGAYQVITIMDSRPWIWDTVLIYSSAGGERGGQLKSNTEKTGDTASEQVIWKFQLILLLYQTICVIPYIRYTMNLVWYEEHRIECVIVIRRSSSVASCCLHKYLCCNTILEMNLHVWQFTIYSVCRSMASVTTYRLCLVLGLVIIQVI